jgi:hypothetical protein
MEVTEHLVHNERVKLQATLLNTTAVALFVSGGIQTVLDASRGHTTLNLGSAALGLVLWTVAFCLHRWAFMLLGTLREKEPEVSA